MAKTFTLPINSKPYQNVDSIVLDQNSEELYDLTIDELGNSNKRSGTLKLTQLITNKGIDGNFWWEEKQIMIWVSDGNIFKQIDDTGTLIDLTNDKLEDTGTPTFAQNGNYLVIANGGRMIYTDGTATTIYIADADAPTSVTHVSFLDQWLIVNEVGTSKFYFADFTGAPTTWFAVDVYSAEANPDSLIALYVNKRIIVLGGTQSIEFWANDGISPFFRLQGTTTAKGMMSKHCTVFANEVGYYFDDRRRLVRMDGTNTTILSTPFDKTIQSFNTVDDCFAFYTTEQGKHIILFVFPTEDVTLFYDLLGEYWGNWSFYDVALNKRRRFIANCYAYARPWNKHYIGHWQNSDILELNLNYYNDNGQEIHISKISGHIDHDLPDKEKTSRKVTFRLKTGSGLPSNQEPFLKLRWRDNGSLEWSNWRYISLKLQGHNSFVVSTYDLGSYFTRQWEVAMASSIPLTIGKVVEEVDIYEF